jgi:hypothetical protein
MYGADVARATPGGICGRAADPLPSVVAATV